MENWGSSDWGNISWGNPGGWGSGGWISGHINVFDKDTLQNMCTIVRTRMKSPFHNNLYSTISYLGPVPERDRTAIRDWLPHGWRFLAEYEQMFLNVEAKIKDAEANLLLLR
ncbi:hypothetical protein B0H10DRAFT_1943951 [Mycena sp. CBHHK59/15]|nr:hypothetical protein B0H10DRAFT_1943951 [Mycena sp. CBHHK59/15]